MGFIASPQFSCHFFPELFHLSKHICHMELAVKGTKSWEKAAALETHCVFSIPNFSNPQGYKIAVHS